MPGGRVATVGPLASRFAMAKAPAEQSAVRQCPTNAPASSATASVGGQKQQQQQRFLHTNQIQQMYTELQIPQFLQQQQQLQQQNLKLLQQLDQQQIQRYQLQ